MALLISPNITAKLSGKTPPVTQEEIEQCFANSSGCYLEDTREDHKSNPPTQWFISETDRGRELKIVFIQRDNNIAIRTAYDPNDVEKRIYNKFC
jgi:hypothetical protein